MRENFWINCKTNIELGTNTQAGSPRAWLQRAVGAGQTGDLYLQEGSLHPKTIAVAGLWRRDLHMRLPDLQQNKTLYRFFDLPDPLEHGSRARGRENFIGVCSAVPKHEILTWLSVFRRTGAVWIWWAHPEKPDYYTTERKKVYKTLDHAELYRRFEAGDVDCFQLADEYGTHRNNIEYVLKKWQAGKPAERCRNSAPLTLQVREQILEDLRLGTESYTSIAEKYNTSRHTVSKWAKRIGVAADE
jgi:hypothetical protein